MTTQELLRWTTVWVDDDSLLCIQWNDSATFRVVALDVDKGEFQHAEIDAFTAECATKAEAIRVAESWYELNIEE